MKGVRLENEIDRKRQSTTEREREREIKDDNNKNIQQTEKKAKRK